MTGLENPEAELEYLIQKALNSSQYLIRSVEVKLAKFSALVFAKSISSIDFKALSSPLTYTSSPHLINILEYVARDDREVTHVIAVVCKSQQIGELHE